MTRDEVIQVMEYNYIRQTENFDQQITSARLRETLEKILDYIDDCCQGGGGGETPVLMPTISKLPSITVSLNNGGYYEVGTTGVIPSYTISLSDGKYTCAGVSTNAGVQATAFTVTSNDGTGSYDGPNSAGTLTPITSITDNTDYKISASAATTDGQPAKNSAGEDTNIKIQATVLTGTSNSSIKGYRKIYAGSSGESQSEEYTRERLEELSYKGNGKTVSSTFSFNVSVGAKSIVIALPYGKRISQEEGGLYGSSQGPIPLSNFLLAQVSIDGLNDAPSHIYNIYTYNPVIEWVNNETITVTLM